MSIASENAKQIRNAMEVSVNIGVSAGSEMAYLGGNNTMKVWPDNATSQGSEINFWPWRKIADFQGDGFPLDGSYTLWDQDYYNSESKGVIGYRSIVGSNMTASIYFQQQDTYHVPALTIRFASGEGTVTVDGIEYDIQDTVVIPCLGSVTPARFHSSVGSRRIEIFSVTPGFNLTFNNENIISCTLALRADLSPANPSFPVSEIELQAFQNNDLSSALINIDEDTRVTYRAGYPGSYSTARSFYLSEPIKTEGKVITIKAEDSSHLLDSVQVPVQLYNTKRTTGQQRLYTFFRDAIKKCGISPVYIQSAPPQSGDDVKEKSVIFIERSTREHVQNIMNLAHYENFWPVFVDAGTPRISWSKPTAKWDIYEEDCGEIRKDTQQNIAAISTDYEGGLTTEIQKAEIPEYLYSDPGRYFYGQETDPGLLGEALSVKAGTNVIENFESYYWKYDVLGQTTTRIWTRVNTLCFRPSKTTTQSGANKVFVRGYPIIIGYRLVGSPAPNVITAPDNRPGIVMAVEPIVYGTIHQGSEMTHEPYRQTAIFPRYETLFDRSPITGSFLWKGDPRMQPRDVFNFHRLNGTVEACTIESIELKHEGGGTTATISYRLGVV